MRIPLYSQHNAPTSPGIGHRGLWFERFFNQYDSTWKIVEENPQAQTKEGKKEWIRLTAKEDCGDRESLHDFAVRQANLCEALGGQPRVFLTDWHFATGLGNPHPVENGYAWHPTLGVPYLTGAAVKGLIRAWVENWMQFEGADEREQQDKRLGTLYRWFGSEHKDPRKRNELREDGFYPPSQGEGLDTEAGAFLFFDAVPLEPVKLACDVMTPHYGKWYELGGEIKNVDADPDKVPADWHDPVPVPFLVVKKARFLFSTAPRTMQARVDIGAVMQALQDALDWLGAGAKTAVGYGAMSRDEDSETGLRRVLDDEKEQARAAADAARADAEHEQWLSEMNPFDRALQLIADARPDKSQSEVSAILGKLKQGEWDGDEKVKVAGWLAKRMQHTGDWREQSQKKNPEKDTRYQNTLLVKAWLAGI